MNVIAELDRFAELTDLEEVRTRVSEAILWIPSQIEHVIPSTVIGQDGVRLASVFLASQDHITEVRISTPKNHFDITRSVLRNINVERGMMEVQTGSDAKIVYQTATVLLIHSSEGRYGSTLHYAGREPADEWLTRIREAFPATSLSPIN